ncbi:MAG: hypothetical protein PVH96_08030 [Gemmatimonadota bacterium]|jgi:hypothetical protein
MLAAVVGCLLTAHCLGLFSTYVLGHNSVKGLVPLFNMDLEQNIPAIVYAAFFVVGSGGFYALHRLDRLSPPGSRHWMVLSFLFLFLALDKAIELHGHLTVPVRSLLGTSGFFYFAWIVPYGAVVAVLSLYLLPRILALPKSIRTLFLLSAIAYLLGSIVFVGIGGFYGQVYDALSTAEQQSYPRMLEYDLVATAEDALEFFGLATLIYAQACLLNLRGKDLQIQFR